MLKISKNYGAKLFIYKAASSDAEGRYNYSRKIISNTQNLIVAPPGSGKSNLTNLSAWSYWKAGYTVIYLTEKDNSPLENAFCNFPVNAGYQKKLLEKQNLPQEIVPIKTYHPFSFNVPYRQKFPDCMRFITFSLKDLTEDSLAALLATGTAQDSQVVRICSNILSRMKMDEGIFVFLRRFYELLNSDDAEVSADPRDMGMPLSVAIPGDRRDIAKSVNAFSAFYEDFFMQEDEAPTNISMEDVINDQEHMHFFTAKWIKNERVRYFYLILVLESINRALASGNVKRPLCIVFEEIKILLPASATISYQMVLSERLKKMLSSMRSAAKGVTTISTTQNYYLTNRDFRSSVDNLILGRLHPEDIKSIMRDFDLTREQSAVLNRINRYEFCDFSDLKKDDCPIFRCFICPFALKEESSKDFFAMSKIYYPEKQRMFTTEFNEMLAKREKIWQEQVNWHKNAGKAILEKILKPEAAAAKAEEKKIDIPMLCYSTKLKNPTWSWNELKRYLEEFGLNSVVTVQRNVFDRCIENKDFDNAKKWFTQRFVKMNYNSKFSFIFPEIDIDSVDENIDEDAPVLPAPGPIDRALDPEMKEWAEQSK